jgi:5-methylcytosine-specific restriction endonuclease McrA
LGRALVLNATYEPLCVVPARRAVVLVLKSKAHVEKHNGQVFRSEKLTIHVPSVVRLNYYVKVPFRARATLSRRAVLTRDEFQCQYCGARAENVDHVVPRSRGGEHVWENVVACCRRCNARKENHLASEVGLTLKRLPRAPRGSLLLKVAVGHFDPDWEPYLELMPSDGLVPAAAAARS